MRGSQFALIWTAATAACADTTELFLATEGQSLILATVDKTGGVQLVAYDTTGAQSPIRRDGIEYGTELIALSYDEGLAELGVVEGTITTVSEGRLLPKPVKSIHRLTAGDEPEGWAELAELPTSISTVRTERGEHCARFSTRRLPLPGSEGKSATLGLSLGPERGMIVLSDLRLFTVDADGPRLVSEPLPFGQILAGYYDARADEAWLFSSSGRVLRGHPDRGFEEAAPVPTRRALTWVDGSPADQPFEIFAVTSSVGVFHFDGATWEERAMDASMVDIRSLARIAWSRPNRAIAIGIAPNAALEIDGNAARAIAVEGLEGGITTPDTPRVVRHMLPAATWGTMIGSRSGVLLTQQGGTFRPLVNFPGGRLELITPFRRGLVFGGDDGVLAEVLSNRSLCSAVNYASTTDLPFLDVLPVGESLAAFHRAAPAGDALDVVLLDPD